MIDCIWKVTGSGYPALTVTDGAKIYGGHYMAANDATEGIATEGGAAVNAAITGITINKPLSAQITNDIAVPDIQEDVNAWF